MYDMCGIIVLNLIISDKNVLQTLSMKIDICIVALLLCQIPYVLYHCNEELNDLYSSPNIVRVIKSRRMRWAGHVVHMGEEMGV